MKIKQVFSWVKYMDLNVKALCLAPSLCHLLIKSMTLLSKKLTEHMVCQTLYKKRTGKTWSLCSRNFYINEGDKEQLEVLLLLSLLHLYS